MRAISCLAIVLCLGVVSCADKPQDSAKPITSELQSDSKPSEVGYPEQAQKKQESNVPSGSVTSIEITQLFMLKQEDKVHIIDVRPPLYYHLGHIDGAVNLPIIKYDSKISEQLPAIKEAKKAVKFIVLYCQNINCPDAYKTSLKLSPLGYDVSIYRGGWEEWKNAGLE